MKTAPDTGRRIVLVTFGSPGDVQPFLAIGQALEALGQRAVIATSAAHCGQVAAANLECIPVRPDRELCQQDPDFLDRVLRGHETPASVFRQMFLPALRESVTDVTAATEGADAVVTHPLAASGRIAAEIHGVPWVSAVMQPMGYLSVYEPPVIGPSWIAALLRALGPGPTRSWHRVARALTGFWAGEWRNLRDELRLPVSSEHPLWEGQHSRLLSLGLFPRALGAPQPDWPPQARVTGFPFYRSADQALERRIDAFLDAGDAPLAFTLGTTAVHDPGRFYEESAAAAAQLGLRAVLVGAPKGNERMAIQSDELLVVPYAAHHLLFPRARAIVHQGGIGTLSEALLARRPMLIMPYGHDQADNAWRACRLGVARVLPRRHYRRDAVRRALRGLLEETAQTTAIMRVGEAISREEGARSAARHIVAALS